MKHKSDVNARIEKLAKQLQGLQTASTIAKKLGVDERTAVNYAWLLRKKGYLKTAYGGPKARIYRISPAIRKERGKSLYEVINGNSRVNVIVKNDYIIHKKVTVEEALARAVATGRFRTVLASLGLFNKIRNWQRLCAYAKKWGVANKVGALYDVARQAMRTKRMDERTRKALMRQKSGGRYIVENIKSKDFQDIEKKWDVFVPFNRQDLGEYNDKFG